MNITDLIDRWNADEGKPYKGSLIDVAAYAEDPENLGCMCAQGQVLHLIGGWSRARLLSVEQEIADAETAQLLNISRAHSVLLRAVNDNATGAPAVVLTEPSQVLGDQWSVVLDFWVHLDGMTFEQRDAAWDAAWAAAWDVAWAAAGAAALAAAGDVAGDVAWAVAGAVARAAAGATNEIQGANALTAAGTPFFFLPLFGFASPAEIPKRPDSYGLAK